MEDKDWLILLKALALVFILFLSLIFGCLPILWSKMKSNIKFVGCANSFSAGIFLAICLMHILPEAHEGFSDYWEENGMKPFPLAFLLAILSYVIILIMEKIAFDPHSLMHDEEGDGHGHGHAHGGHGHAHGGDHGHNHGKAGHSHEHGEHQHHNEASNDHDHHDHSHDHDHKHHHHDTTSLVSDNSIQAKSINKTNRGKLSDLKEHLVPKKSVNTSSYLANPGPFQKDVYEESHSEDEDDPQPKKNYAEKTFKNIMSFKQQIATKVSVIDNVRKTILASRIEGKEPINQEVPSSLTPYILLGALSFHGIFEGLALGLQKELGGLINLMIAVCMHKWAEALTLGISFAKKKADTRTAQKMMLIFSLTGPVGLAVGWGLADSSIVVECTFMSLAAGTFLFISTTEIVVEEFSFSIHKWLKLVCFLVGVGVICCLALIPEDDGDKKEKTRLLQAISKGVFE